MASTQEGHWLGPAALTIFALSGLSGLIYQSIWSQYLGLYLGHAAYAQSLVLAIFMGGMAAGSWWASRRAIGWRNLLRAYSGVELVIGLAAVAFHPIYLWATGFAYDVAFPSLPGGWPVQAFKWTSGAVLILPQSILLGMTFPLMSNGLMRRLRAGDGAILSGLYFTNSIGAAAGALIATFVLLPAVGLPGALRFGAIVNVLVALFAFVLSRSAEPVPAPAAQRARRVDGQLILLAAAFVTGATSFVYEIGWVRMLSMALGTTVHAFELMLAAFIGGLAFGGLWIRRRIDGLVQPIGAAGYVQILMGLAALSSLWLYMQSFDWVAWLLQALARTDAGYTAYNAVSATVAILIMAPTAFFAGMTLPLFTLALLRAGGGEASVGRIYAANTLGAIVGVIAAVHVLMPLLGLRTAMIIAAAGDLALGIVLLQRVRGAALRAAVLCCVAIVATIAFARFDRLVMTSGVFRTGVAHVDPKSEKLLFYRDGKTASVAVTEANGARSIETNGKPDAAIQMQQDKPPTYDEYTMTLVGLLPLTLHPGASLEVANIGFGSGMTTNTLLGDSRVASVDTVEIEAAMVEGARAFLPVVERAYTDPRSHVHIEDARTFFSSHGKRYDIITSEPSNPWVSGVASLFSREFYRFIPRHLKPGGLFVQWLHTYELSDELVAVIGNTLTRSFGGYRIYQANDGDLIFVARVDGVLGDFDPAVLAQPALTGTLKRLSLATIADLRFRQIGDQQSLAPLFALLSRRVNSDFYPVLSLEAPRARFRSDRAMTLTFLATADVPLVEVLGHVAVDPPQALGRPLELPRSDALVRAEAIALALSSKDRNAPVTPIANVTVLDTIGACGDVPVRDAIDVLGKLGGQTIPFLPEPSLHGVWIDPAWQHCAHTAPAVSDMLGVLSALSARDFAAAGERASKMLASGNADISNTSRDYLLRIAMLSALATGHPEDVRKIEDGPGAAVPPQQATIWQHVYMLAIAQERHGKASGVAQAGR